MKADELRYLIRAMDYYDLNTENEDIERIDEEIAYMLGVEDYPIVFNSDVEPLIKTLTIVLKQLKLIRDVNTKMLEQNKDIEKYMTLKTEYEVN